MLVNRLHHCRRLTRAGMQGVRVGCIGLAHSWACHISDCAINKQHMKTVNLIPVSVENKHVQMMLQQG